MPKKAKPTIESVTAAIKRYRTKMYRAIRQLEKLERQRDRLEKAPRVYAKIVDATERPRGPASICDLANTVGPAIQESIKDQGIVGTCPDLPSFLRRTPDPAAEQIKAEQAEHKKKKARGRIETMKAKQRGDLKKMPLSGKAALEAIRNS